jgi:hypothetical protein
MTPYQKGTHTFLYLSGTVRTYLHKYMRSYISNRLQIDTNLHICKCIYVCMYGCVYMDVCMGVAGGGRWTPRRCVRR